MNVQINQLVKSLLQKDSLSTCSVEELRQFADRHPYFGAAQLLLAKKLQSEDPDQYHEQLQKTFLFFHNPLWVEHLLNETGKATITKAGPGVADNLVIPVIPPIENKQAEKTDAAVEILPNQPARAADIEISPAQTVEAVPELEQPVAKSEEKVIETSILQSIPVDATPAELLFEPYYSVDYFASQGIKFKDEEMPKDKFGKQLKSFTDWLRTMKRLPASEIAPEPLTELKVEQLAEHSLEDREVLTEAMAEVWKKQGNTAKAAETYGKLSLLDPSKSVYFAAKIEDLKKRI